MLTSGLHPADGTGLLTLPSYLGAYWCHPPLLAPSIVEMRFEVDLAPETSDDRNKSYSVVDDHDESSDDEAKLQSRVKIVAFLSK